MAISTYLQRAVTPDQITQPNRGLEGPKVSKGTLRPDFQTKTRPRIFLKAQCHHKIQEGVCKEIQV
jgi:hypothetical protein